jgi:lactoylglutathione lyase
MYFTYTGIRVTDLKRSVDFYKKTLGMKVILRGKMKNGGIFIHLKSPKSEQRLELNWYPTDSPYNTKYRTGADLDHLAFWSDDVRRDFANLIEKGAIAAIEPFMEGRYELAFLKDPDGIWIELLGRTRRGRDKD